MQEKYWHPRNRSKMSGVGRRANDIGFRHPSKVRVSVQTPSSPLLYFTNTTGLCHGPWVGTGIPAPIGPSTCFALHLSSFDQGAELAAIRREYFRIVLTLLAALLLHDFVSDWGHRALKSENTSFNLCVCPGFSWRSDSNCRRRNSWGFVPLDLRRFRQGKVTV